MDQIKSKKHTVNNRNYFREEVIGPGISCFLTTPRGRLIEGVVRDISDTGAGIATATEELEVGMKVQIVFVVTSGQKVRFQGFVKHVEYDCRHCGIHFTTGPENLDAAFDPRKIIEPKADDERAPKCARCETQMELGYIVDHTHVSRGREMICQPEWARGGAVRGGTTPDGTTTPVDTYCCPECGLLESYVKKT